MRLTLQLTWFSMPIADRRRRELFSRVAHFPLGIIRTNNDLSHRVNAYLVNFFRAYRLLSAFIITTRMQSAVICSWKTARVRVLWAAVLWVALVLWAASFPAVGRSSNRRISHRASIAFAPMIESSPPATEFA